MGKSRRKKPHKKEDSQQDNDVEDSRIADLSAIPTPKIGVKFPVLNRESDESNFEQLTANKLNNYIVGMRSAVKKAKFFEEQRCKQKIKLCTKRHMKPDDEQKRQRQLEELGKQMNLFKSVPNDDVAKFALVNTKTRGTLMLQKETTLTEKCLYTLATSQQVVKKVEEFRKTYKDWDVRTAYFLQRLGQQYRTAKKEKNDKTGKAESKTSTDAIDLNDGKDTSDDEDGEANVSEDESNEEVSDVEMGTDSEDEEIVANRRKLLLGICGIKEDSSRPKIIPKPRKRILECDDEITEKATSSQTVVKKINLSDGGELELGDVPKCSTNYQKKDKHINIEEGEEDAEGPSFFLKSTGKSVTTASSLGKTRREQKPQASRNKNNDKITNNSKDPEMIHPSWAARREAKKIQENAKPQGKRIVFDD